MTLFAAIISTLVGILALTVGAVARGAILLGLGLLLVVGHRLSTERFRWFTGYRRSLIALAIVALALVAVFWPTPLILFDVGMTAVPP